MGGRQANLHVPLLLICLVALVCLHHHLPLTLPHSLTMTILRASEAVQRVASRSGATPGAPPRRSGLGTTVLQLYRAFMRLARRNTEPTRSSMQQQIRTEFRRRQQWPARDFETIEQFISKGQRRLAMLQTSGVQVAVVTRSTTSTS